MQKNENQYKNMYKVHRYIFCLITRYIHPVQIEQTRPIIMHM